MTGKDKVVTLCGSTRSSTRSGIKRAIIFVLAFSISISCCPAPTDWYTPSNENKPFLRWWWLGSAVDEEGLTYNLEEFAEKGFGGVEITPIYGLKNNENNDRVFLSQEWMEALSFTMSEASRLGLQVDMNNGTGWPFGGSWITEENAAKKFDFNADTSRILVANTWQKVKRVGTGSEGLVIDHYSKAALEAFLSPVDAAFKESSCPWPDTFFNDSFEVYGSSWTEGLEDAFYNDHGYRIEDHLKAFARNDGSEESVKVVGDYRSTLSRFYLDNFTIPWTAWAHDRGVRTRNQAHGAPSNLIDIYAAADIPECESFGQSPFEIKGLHRSGLTRVNDADPAAFKFASSAAHLSGKKFTSCEILTWLTEHFHTTLALCKPEIDLAFASGVNHVYFHGAPYSPNEVAFPGWKFYATINMSPTNRSLWDNVSVLTNYVTRCQAFLSAGEPDADFLIYFPIEDIWRAQYPTQFMMLSIHEMNKTMSRFKDDVIDILAQGYDVDYISDAFLAGLKVTADGKLMTAAGTEYGALVLPTQTEYMPEVTREKIEYLKANGARVVTLDNLDEAGVHPEAIRRVPGIHMIRRKNECGGKNYFIANLGSSDLDTTIVFATKAASVELMDAMTGTIGLSECKSVGEGTSVRIQLASGASMMLKTFPKKVSGIARWPYVGPVDRSISLKHNAWKLTFERSEPAMPEKEYALDSLCAWSILPGGDVNEALGVYQTEINIANLPDFGSWSLEVDDLRECAEVYLNGELAGTMIAAPFSLNLGGMLKEGCNTLAIKVWNLPANRIAQMDREGKVWRVFKDANIQCVNSSSILPEQRQKYTWWELVPSGINSDVRLVHRRSY